MKIKDLSPIPLWSYFYDICNIPHPSKYEEKIKDYIIEFARNHNLSAIEDSAGNIIIKKNAYPGYENKKVIALQAHLDMVPQKNESTEHNFQKDPIIPYIDEEWVKAKDTTLGADNGIGVAACLSVLSNKDIEHGPIEVLFTVDEETSMHGANGLKPGVLDAEYLINLDSEQEGEFYIGCAGGTDIKLSENLNRTSFNNSSDKKAVSLVIKGLKGGHSGCDIDKGRANANQLLARFLNDCQTKFSLANIKGGSLVNAIPREANAVIIIDEKSLAFLEDEVRKFEEQIKIEFNNSEKELIFFSIPLDTFPKDIYTDNLKFRLLNLLNSSPNGLIKMCDNLDGVVETSLNMGVIEEGKNEVSIMFLIRSLHDGARDAIASKLKSLAQISGFEFSILDSYPGWWPNTDSTIANLFSDVYKRLYNRYPKKMVIHAGLECGLFKSSYPNIKMLSIGPTIKNPHSPDECVNIESVQLFWEQLKELIKSIPDK